MIVQNDRGNQFSSYTVCGGNQQRPAAPRLSFHRAAGAGRRQSVPVPGHVNCAQLLTVDTGRLEGLIGVLSDEKMREVDAALRYELSL